MNTNLKKCENEGKVPKEESMKNADLLEKSTLTFHLIDLGIMSLSYDITRDWSEEEVKQYQLLAAAINRTFPKLKCYITGGTYVLKSKN